jgi:L-iditol 2-dehydrogenase
MGASKIILSEISEKRLKQAEQFGCDVLVNPAKENLTEIVKSETNGIGADAVIVAAPAIQPQAATLDYVRKQGCVCLFASLPVGNSMLNIDSRLIHYGEIKLVGSSDSTPEHVKCAVDLLTENKLPADKIASHILGLEDYMQAFELMQSGEALRVILKP